MKKFRLLIVLSLVGLIGVMGAVSGCRPGQSSSTLTLAFDGLEMLGEGHFEGWAIFGDEKVSTGKFSADDDFTFTVDRDLTEADMIVITIEPEGDTDDIPSGVVLLAGSVNGNQASLAFPVDLSGVAGTYILATPTNGPETDELSGIWFLALPGPSASLILPALPAGWVYEGWVVNMGTPLTSGRFLTPEGADDFNGYSGSEPSPPFPGEDYLLNPPQGVSFPLNLADGASLAVISVEPDLNGNDPTGPAPFQIKPLVGEIPAGAQDHANLPMGANLGSVPSGMASISR